MANTRHLKRHSMPVSWGVKRKNIAFITRPQPGSHSREYVTSALVLLRDVLKYAQTTKEAKYITQHEKIIVNGREIKEIKAPIGLFDVVEIPATKQKFIVLFDTFGKIKLVDTKANSMFLKVTGKKITKGKKFQLNFMNGYNILVDEKTFKGVNVDDSVEFDFTKKKVVKTIPLKEKSFVYVFDGKFQGNVGEIKSFTHYKGLAVDTIDVTIGKETHTTARAYCFAVGTKKEDIKELI